MHNSLSPKLISLHASYFGLTTGRDNDIINPIGQYCFHRMEVKHRKVDEKMKRFLKMSDKADFYEVVQQILTAISQYKKQIAFSGGINPVILAMDLNNNHGYLGSNAVKIEANGPILAALPSKNDILAALPVEPATDQMKTDQEPPKTC